MNTSNFPLSERSFEFEFRFWNFTLVRFSTFAHELCTLLFCQVSRYSNVVAVLALGSCGFVFALRHPCES